MKPNKIKEDNIRHMAKLNQILKSPEYAAEEKIDGCHYIQVAGYFFSSDHVEKTDNFPHLRDFFRKLNMPNLILDGEINYIGKTSQFCTRVTGADPSTAVKFQEEYGFIHYTIFDILRTPKGTWTLNQPYEVRRKILEYFYDNYVRNTPAEEFIHLTKMTVENKELFKDQILASGGEGIILKKLDSTYIMGKRPMWVWMKIKQKDEADLIITGFQPPTKEYTGSDFDNWPYWMEDPETGLVIPVSKYYYFGWIGAVELSAYVDGKLQKICTASGMDEELRKDMSEFPHKYLNKVARIGYMELTEAGYPRHPKFLGLHPDKQPQECTWQFNEK